MFLNQFLAGFSFVSGPNVRYAFIVIVGFISTIIFLLILKKTSNQRKIREHKNKIFGNILQIRLYQDKFSVLVGSIVRILHHNILYLKHMLLPLVFISLPFILFSAQINDWCGYKPLEINQSFIIQAKLDANALQEPLPVTLEKVFCKTSPNIVLETPPLRIESERGVFWRAKLIEPAQPNHSYLHIGLQGSDSVVEKRIVTDYHYTRFSPVKGKWSFRNGVFNNVEGFIAKDAVIESVSAEYYRANYAFLFWHVDSIILYILFTLIFAFALKGFLKVTI